MDGQLSLFDGFIEKPKTETEKRIEVAEKTLFDMAKEVDSKPKPTQTVKPTEKKPEPKTNTNIIQFPKPKPEVKPTPTQGNATYEDCQKKFASDLAKYKDADSQYVITGLLELCKVDKNFCNRVMLKEKSYEGAYQYMFESAKNGIGAYKVGNSGAFMDRDTALGICIDYYNKK